VQRTLSFFIVPGFVRAEALETIGADFPMIQHPGELSAIQFELWSRLPLSWMRNSKPWDDGHRCGNWI
jgi:hypothetical protein